MSRKLKYVGSLLAAFAPVAMVAGGAAWIYPPAGLIVFGALWYLETRFSHEERDRRRARRTIS